MTEKEELLQANKWITSNLTKVDREVLKRFRIVLKCLIKEGLLAAPSDADMASYRLLSVIKEEVNLELYRTAFRSKNKKL